MLFVAHLSHLSSSASSLSAPQPRARALEEAVTYASLLLRFLELLLVRLQCALPLLQNYLFFVCLHVGFESHPHTRRSRHTYYSHTNTLTRSHTRTQYTHLVLPVLPWGQVYARLRVRSPWGTATSVSQHNPLLRAITPTNIQTHTPARGRNFPAQRLQMPRRERRPFLLPSCQKGG